LQIQVVNASTIGEINAAFAAVVRERAHALVVTSDAFFASRRVQLATLATRDRIPAAYPGDARQRRKGGSASGQVQKSTADFHVFPPWTVATDKIYARVP
jgi:hypothetical protein